jgi:hypothetical protein
VPDKNCTLIGYDILVVLRRVFDLVKDEQIRLTAEHLMAMEEDLKYRKRYSVAQEQAQRARQTFNDRICRVSPVNRIDIRVPDKKRHRRINPG